MSARIITGRNYVETLILTLMAIEMENPTLEARESITRRLEEELCSISSGMRFMKNMYKKLVYEKIEDEFKDVAKPDLDGCFLYEQVLNWIKENKNVLLGKKSIYMSKYDVDRAVREIALRIIRTSVMGAFYIGGFIGVMRE